MKNKLTALLGPALIIGLVFLYFSMPKKGPEIEQSPEVTQAVAKTEEGQPIEKAGDILNSPKETPTTNEANAKEGQKTDKANPLAWDRNFEELLDLSGVEKQIKNFDELLKKQLDLDMSSKDGPAWTKIMAKHFKSKYILEEIKNLKIRQRTPGND